MKRLKLTKGQYAIVDDEDYPYLSRFPFNVSDNKRGTFNVAFNVSINGHQLVRVPMWRFIIRAKIQRKIVFLNGNPLDHRKENLFLASPSEFNANARPRTKNDKRGAKTSIYKGVSYNKRTKIWHAEIQKKGVIYQKDFKTERNAGLWYNKKAEELFGDIAFKNNIKK